MVHSWQTDAFKDPTWDPDTHVDITAKALSGMPNIQRVILRNHRCSPRDNPRLYHMDEIDQAVSGPRSSQNYRVSIEGRPFPWAARRRILPPDTYADFDYGFGVMYGALAGVCH
jgi:hypothetical protein